MSAPSPRLLLITGTGRSGTSTMSGIFHHLGVAVPGPHLGANESNPKGFYESRWSVRFHNDLLSRARVNLMDSRPTAYDDLQAALTRADRRKLARWVGKTADQLDLVVVKDPRSVWTQTLWHEAAGEHGLDVHYISMLRHPAEVIGSRAKYYGSDDTVERQRYEVSNVARWINNQLVNERRTRGHRRSFVRYTDLLADWRSELARLSDEFDLVWPGDITPGNPSPVDDFVNPDLRRVQVTWDDLQIPAELQEIAEGIWQATNTLRDNAGVDDAASASLDGLRGRYDSLFHASAAISDDATTARVTQLKAERDRLAAALAEVPAAEAAGAPRRPRDERRLEDVGGRELLRTAWTRALRRVRPGRHTQD